MTTTAPDTVDLTAQNGTAPKRRGRPPGSKNKPKVEGQATPRKRGRPRKTTTTATKPARKTTPSRRVPVKSATSMPSIGTVFPVREAHAILIEKDGLVVMNRNGDSYLVVAPVIVDRRK